MAVRYRLMAAALGNGDLGLWWTIRSVWCVHLVALTWPAVVAADQLIRHPAVTPRALVRWYVPMAMAGLGVIVLGQIGLVPESGVGMRLALLGAWARAAGLLLGSFSIILIVVGGMVWRRLLPGPVKTSLSALLAAYALVGLEGVVQLVRPSPAPWLWPEMIAFLALWNAFQTAQRASM